VVEQRQHVLGHEVIGMVSLERSAVIVKSTLMTRSVGFGRFSAGQRLPSSSQTGRGE
jgi:hypothetical protein